MCVNIRSNRTKDANGKQKKRRHRSLCVHNPNDKYSIQFVILHNTLHFICVPIFLRKSLNILFTWSFQCGFLYVQFFFLSLSLGAYSLDIARYQSNKPRFFFGANVNFYIRFEMPYFFYSVWSLQIVVYIFYCFHLPFPQNELPRVINFDQDVKTNQPYCDI